MSFYLDPADTIPRRVVPQSVSTTYDFLFNSPETAFQLDAFQLDSFQIYDSWGWEDIPAVLKSPKALPIDPNDVFPTTSPITIVGWWNDTTTVDQHPTTIRPSATSDVLPAIVSGSRGWETTVVDRRSTTVRPITDTNVLPAIVAGSQGWESASIDQHSTTVRPSTDTYALPAIVASSQGWESSSIDQHSTTVRPSTDTYVLPAIVAGSQGWERASIDQHSTTVRPGTDTDVVPAIVAGSQGWETVAVDQRSMTVRPSTHTYEMPANVTGSRGWESTSIDQHSTTIRPGTDTDVVPAIVAGSQGWETAAVDQRSMTSRPSTHTYELPAIVTGSRGWESTSIDQHSTTVRPNTDTDVVPAIMASSQGWDTAAVDHRSMTVRPSTHTYELPAIVAGSQGWESTSIDQHSITICPNTDTSVLPAIMVSSQGWESTAIDHHSMTMLSISDAVVPPIITIGEWGWEIANPNLRSTTNLSIVDADVLPFTSPTVNSWWNDAAEHQRLSFTHQPAEMESFPTLLAVVVNWGFENQTFIALRRAKTEFKIEDNLSYLPAVLGSWGYEEVSAASRWSESIIDKYIDVLPYVSSGPSPIPNLPKEVKIDGGWWNPDAPRVEIVDSPTPEQIADYLDSSWEEESKRRQKFFPDAVLGRDEYSRERTERQRQRGQLARSDLPIAYRFAPDQPSRARTRAVMFALDARQAGLPVSQIDVFTLSSKLGVFSKERERKMMGGTALRVVPQNPADRVKLAKLGQTHLYQLVEWSSTSLFLFDETTLGGRVPAYAWLGLGVGWGLWLGHELWNKTNAVVPIEREIPASRQKPRKTKK